MHTTTKTVLSPKMSKNNSKIMSNKESRSTDRPTKSSLSSSALCDSNVMMKLMMTPEQQEQVQEVVSMVVSEVCIITLLKVMDNIIEEKVYNSKTRRFKLTNPTFQKRITNHPGGLDVLYMCGFDDKRAAAAAAAPVVSSNHSVVSNSSGAVVTTTTVLELLPEKEDKEWLWHVRQVLYQHGQTKLGLKKLPPMPAPPTPPPPPQKAARKTSISTILSNSSSQRASADISNGKFRGATSSSSSSRGEQQQQQQQQQQRQVEDEEKKQEGWDLPWESTNSSSSQSHRHVMPPSGGGGGGGGGIELVDKNVAVTEKSNDANTKPSQVKANQQTSPAALDTDASQNISPVSREPEHVNQETCNSLEPDASLPTASPLLPDADLVQQTAEDNCNEDSVTTAPLSQGDDDVDPTLKNLAPAIKRAASWKSKLDEFLATLDNENNDGDIPNDTPTLLGTNSALRPESNETTPTAMNDSENSSIQDEVVPVDDRIKIEPVSLSSTPPKEMTTTTGSSIRTDKTSTLDLILADVDEASPLRFDSNTRKQMGNFLMDSHVRKTNQNASNNTNNRSRATSSNNNKSRKVPSLHDIVNGHDDDDDDDDNNEGENLQGILADMNAAAKTMAAAGSNEYKSTTALDSILAEIDVVLRPDNSSDSNIFSSSNHDSAPQPGSAATNVAKSVDVDTLSPSETVMAARDGDSMPPPSPPSTPNSNTNTGAWSPKIDSDAQSQYMNKLQESLSSFDPENLSQLKSSPPACRGGTQTDSLTAIVETTTMTAQNDGDDWSSLCSAMKKCSLSDEFESCWGALCKLSAVCSHLTPPLDLPPNNLAEYGNSPNHAGAKSRTLLRSWIPTELVTVLWELVMKDEGVNPARTEYVKGQLRQVLFGDNTFLEVWTGDDLPHTSWLRIPNETLIRAGMAFPGVGAKSKVWLLHFCDFLLVDASSWFGRYSILEIFGRINDTAKSDQVESLLNSVDFIQSRLDVLGLEQGTIRHIQDCKNYIDNLLRHEFFKQDGEENPVAVAAEEIGLAVCQHVATCLYRTGQELEKFEGTANRHEKLGLAGALHRLGLAVGEWRDYDFEMQLYGRALVIRREVCEPGSEEIADTLLVIGACHQSQANLGAAMSCYEEALDMFKARLGEHHDKVAEALHNIGVVHCERSELDAAMGNLKSSFKIRQDNRDSKSFDADMSNTLCWIGKVYREQGQLQKAYKYFATACASKEEIAGKDSLDVAEILHNIAVIHDDQGEFVVSLEFYTKSLDIKRRRLGEDHEDVCELLTCIGHVYLLMGEDSKALKVFRRVLEKRTHTKSRSSSLLQTNLLLQTYADVIDILREQASRSFESRSVKDYLAATLLEMAQLYEGVGEYEKCLACLDECLTLASELNDHIRVGQALNTAGIAHAKRRHYDVAMDAFEQALAIRKGFLDEHNLDVAETLHNMGNCAAKQKDFNLARNHYDESLRIKRKILGSSHPSVAQTLHNIGCIMSEQGFDDAAMNYLREALSVRKACLGDDHLEVAYSLHSIGKVQRRRNELNDSIENFKASLRIKSRRLHKKQSSVAETLEQLGELHAIKGDVEQTVFYFEEALVAIKGSSNRSGACKIHEALGKAYDESKDYPKAKLHYAKALKIAEKLYGPRDSRVASIIHRFGNVQRKLGDNQEALLLYQKATKICKDNLGRNDATIADVLSDAGDLQMELGQFEVAHKCFSEALRIRRTVLRGGDVSIAESLLQLGDVEQFTGRFAHAVEYYNESAAIFRVSEGDKSAKLADSLERLGCCHRALREFDKAIDFFDVCIRIRKDAAGSQSLPLAEAYHQLGCVYYEIEKYSKAEQLFRDCVEIRVKCLGEDHLDIADSVLMLGRVCVKINSPHEAMMYFEQAQLIRKTHLGEKHLDYAELIREIGNVHEMNADYKESIKNLNLYLQIRREAVGDDVVVGDVLHSIGSIEFTMQKHNAALKSLATALALFKVLLGDDNLSVAKTLYSLGLVYDAKRDDKEALKYHKEAFRLRRTLLGPDHLHVAQSLDSICALYVRQQNHEKALQGLKEALRIRTLRLGNDNLEVAATLFGMGVVFCELGDRERCKECYLASLKIRREHLGVKSVEVGQTMHNLGSVYGQQQDYEQALKYWKEALVSYKGAGLGDEDHLSAITIGNIHMAESLLADRPRPLTPDPSVVNTVDEEADSWFQDD